VKNKQDGDLDKGRVTDNAQRNIIFVFMELALSDIYFTMLSLDGEVKTHPDVVVP
jgi:hypothetical protein